MKIKFPGDSPGALYGSGIDSIHLMESELVMKSKKPFNHFYYPATQEGGPVMFLILVQHLNTDVWLLTKELNKNER